MCFLCSWAYVKKQMSVVKIQRELKANYTMHVVYEQNLACRESEGVELKTQYDELNTRLDKVNKLESMCTIAYYHESHENVLNSVERLQSCEE